MTDRIEPVAVGAVELAERIDQANEMLGFCCASGICVGAEDNVAALVASLQGAVEYILDVNIC
jgi:hypothetical protein